MRAAKKRLVALFHYSLNPGGYLWLDRLPPMDGLNASFEAVDKRLPLLRRRDGKRMLTNDVYGFFGSAVQRQDAILPMRAATLIASSSATSKSSRPLTKSCRQPMRMQRRPTKN